jgi:membrane dipeptidase
MSEHPRIGSRAQDILSTTLVWDNHGCLPLRAETTHIAQLERYRKAGVRVVSINAGFANMSWVQHMEVLSFMRQWLARQPEAYRLVATCEDLERCRSSEQLGVVFDIEGMYPVQDNPALVQTFYELGVRWMLIAYNRNNNAGGGCLDADQGLTAVGREVIDEMERVGMVLCLSHTGARTAAEALEYARNPAIFSHSNPFSDTAHPRNVSDHLIRACARKGGVIGLSGIGPFLGENSEPVKGLLRQLDYLIDLIGPQHVGLGLDYVFDRESLDRNVRLHPEMYPPGVAGGLTMVEPESVAVIADHLASTNLTDDQVRGVLGENWLRIAQRVWK